MKKSIKKAVKKVLGNSKLERAKRRKENRRLNKQKRKGKKHLRNVMRKAGIKAIKFNKNEINVKGFKNKKENRKGSLKKAINPGIGKLIIPDMKRFSENEINLQYKKLFKGLVKDEGLLNILILQENIVKIKERFDVSMTIYDMNNKKLAEIYKGSGFDLMNAKQASIKLNKGRNVGKTSENPTDKLEDIKSLGWEVEILDSGAIERVETKIIFRNQA